jgi:hypothetical protein
MLASHDGRPEAPEKNRPISGGSGPTSRLTKQVRADDPERTICADVQTRARSRGSPAAAGRAAWVGCTASANSTARPRNSAIAHQRDQLAAIFFGEEKNKEFPPSLR